MSATPASSRSMSTMEREAWLANRLGKRGILVKLFDGATSPDSRKRTLRDAIKSRGLADTKAGVAASEDGTRDVTYAEAFERVYGEKL